MKQADCPDGETPLRSRPIPVWIFAALRISVVIVIVFLIWQHWDHESFQEWKKEAGPVPFFLALALLPLVGVPATPFYLLAGATFGLPTALAGSAAALALHLAISYWLARSPLRRTLSRWLEKSGRRLPTLERLGAWRFTLIVKFLPGLPPVLKHAAIAVAGVPFPVFFTVCFSVSAFYAAGFILLGESAFDHDYTQGVVLVTRW